MASVATMNAWLEQLALTFIPSSSAKPADTRKYKDSFMRRVKNHNFGRTNQFDVIERLAGLEEKFQVLNLDDLAANIFSRRAELRREYEEGVTWVPDALDLLLRLSHEPAKHGRVEQLEKIRFTSAIPHTWEDLDSGNLFDRKGPLWEVPHYSDFSSEDEDEDIATSDSVNPPSSSKQNASHKVDASTVIDLPAETLSVSLDSAQFWHAAGRSITISETQAVREVLFSFGGFPTSILCRRGQVIEPDQRYRIQHLDATTCMALLSQAASIATDIHALRTWLQTSQITSVMQLVQSEIGEVLAAFDRAVSSEHHAILHQATLSGTVSMLQILQRFQQASFPLQAVSFVISQPEPNDSISALTAMHNKLDIAHSSYNLVDLQTLLPIFLSALTLYAKRVDVWLQAGRIQSGEKFFIHKYDAEAPEKRDLWDGWFCMPPNHAALVPSFLKPFVIDIFTIGKTAAFLELLGSSLAEDDVAYLGIAAAALEAANLAVNSPLPFSATFDMTVQRHLATILSSCTSSLKHILETTCGLTMLLDAFDYVYLAKDGVILDTIETKMFDQIDSCVETWNDRFVLSDTLTEAYHRIKCVDVDAVTIQATHTSSRTMESRRRSVKILAAVSISYHISWPLANIISSASMLSYQRVALTLSQTRRALYLLDRRAYFYVQQMLTKSDPPSHAKVTRLVYWQLSLFVKIFYAHLTDCVVQPLTESLRKQFQNPSTGSLDSMIAVHKHYISALEHACLSSKRIKPLRESMIAMLDLCIRFTDLIISAATNTDLLPSSRDENERDIEASSFISAQSRRRHRRRRNMVSQQDDSSSPSENDDDGMGEGYSTFILDEGTSFIQEILKIQADFKRYLDFLVAGLKAVARASMLGPGLANSGPEFEIGDRFELLADSLECILPSRRPGVF
jgi:gamma-tubulin complex component 5